jgi:hypothetical protein
MGCLFAHIHAISSALLMSGLGGITALGKDCVMEADEQGLGLRPQLGLTTTISLHAYCVPLL